MNNWEKNVYIYFCQLTVSPMSRKVKMTHTQKQQWYNDQSPSTAQYSDICQTSGIRNVQSGLLLILSHCLLHRADHTVVQVHVISFILHSQYILFHRRVYKCHIMWMDQSNFPFLELEKNHPVSALVWVNQTLLTWTYCCFRKSLDIILNRTWTATFFNITADVWWYWKGLTKKHTKLDKNYSMFVNVSGESISACFICLAYYNKPDHVYTKAATEIFSGQLDCLGVGGVYV